jgi:hypothetical protein
MAAGDHVPSAIATLCHFSQVIIYRGGGFAAVVNFAMVSAVGLAFFSSRLAVPPVDRGGK